MPVIMLNGTVHLVTIFFCAVHFSYRRWRAHRAVLLSPGGFLEFPESKRPRSLQYDPPERVRLIVATHAPARDDQLLFVSPEMQYTELLNALWRNKEGNFVEVVLGGRAFTLKRLSRGRFMADECGYVPLRVVTCDCGEQEEAFWHAARKAGWQSVTMSTLMVDKSVLYACIAV